MVCVQGRKLGFKKCKFYNRTRAKYSLSRENSDHGKTTIINLINRFYEIQKGEILLDGVNIKDINLRYLRKKVGIVLQDPFIFAKSIKDNIRIGRKFIR